MTNFAYVGKSVPRVDAPEKVTGRAMYTLDLLLPKMLHGKLLGSPFPHARVKNIDTGRAEKLPGVKLVLTAKDIPDYVVWGVMPSCYDQRPLAVDKVRFVGDTVAAVVAASEDIAQEAIELIEVDYEDLPTVFDPREAMREGAPVIHAEKPNNIAFTKHMEFGPVDEMFRIAHHVSVLSTESSRQAHCAFETHVSIAEWSPSGNLTVYNSSQCPSLSSQYFAKCLHIPEANVRVVTNYVGGGFGGKATSKFNIDFLSIIAAKKLGRPVKFYYTREEEFLLATHRTKQYHTIRIATDKEGLLLAREVKMVVDNGGYSDYGPVVGAITAHMGGSLYNFKAYRHHADVVYTNVPPGGAMRGVGNAGYTFGTESAMDNHARQIGMDSAEFRMKNLVKKGDTTIIGARISSCGARECLREAVKRVPWKGPRPTGGARKRGYGLAMAVHFTGTRAMGPETAGAFIKMNKDGTVQVLSGTIEMGNGSNTTLSQICAETLGIRVEDVQIINGDTAVNPYGWGVRGSRTTAIDGMATRLAAIQARDMLFRGAAQLLECDAADLDARDGTIFVKSSPDRNVTHGQAYMKIYDKQGSEAVYTAASYDSPSETPDPATGYGNWSAAYSFGAKVAEVEVDTETGAVEVLRIVSVNDVGTVVNPAGAQGQLDGGALMGLGYALMEDFQVEGGQPVNPNWLDYKFPSTQDMPQLEAVLVETESPSGPYGAKGLGEMVQLATEPAIANAVYDAVGVRITSLPVTPEKVLRGLRELAGASA
ncbi:MAG: xanthine dehydrogenase family protein molybdopterin-binding subunit [Candidatus Tectomicrobia bacterium]|uniref:Xanthine dehydrogenase family protein molybdopterin-binding subunit n=1 Tax=Tectimicrobiota bacterium TaxID=2528274 RepID=A0A932I2D8_UNCTE|nr:xanthine dehydrogenase family protein molybdopterin-binding subunit [Candidatus Tectomicrobia bacterium]